VPPSLEERRLRLEAESPGAPAGKIVAGSEPGGYPICYNSPRDLPDSDPIRDLLERSKTIAVVGLSDSPLRPSYGVSAYMQAQGYRIIPVNPQIAGALGEKSYPSLLEVPVPIDIVNVFRRPEFAEEVVDQAIRLRIPAVWMQEGVVHPAAAEKARKAGVFVAMDLCILKEHRARFG